MERGNRADAPGLWAIEGGIFEVPRQIPFDVNVSSMQFNPDGTASSGTVTIGRTNEEHYTITVNTTTGKITAERH